MKRFLTLIAAVFTVTAALAQDVDRWADFGRYAEANAALTKRPDVVFMGNSITQGWAGQHPAFFADNNYVGRGISGQVTAQMVERFRPDVLDLRPGAVVILAGTNDIARNQGYISIPHIAMNIVAMANLARANGVEVVICSVLPAAHYPWRPEVADVPTKVRLLNRMLRDWAAENGVVYLDFFSAMEDGNGGLPKAFAGDGIHPTSAGYDVMERMIKPTIDALLSARRSK